MNLLALTLIVFGFFVIWHLVYESIIAPSLRLLLRYRLFAVRDAVRRLRMERPEEFSRAAFEILNNSLNQQIRLLGRIHGSDLRAMNRAYENDTDFRNAVDRRTEVLESCALDAVKDLKRSASQLFICGVVINSGGWLPYIVPVVLCWAGWERMKKLGRIFVAAPNQGLSNLARA